MRALIPLTLVLFAVACSTTVTGGPGTGHDNLRGDQGGGGTGGGGGSSPGGVQNAACSQPLPSPLPPVPMFNSDDGVRPNFDKWRDLSCSSSPALCDVRADCDGDACLNTHDKTGVCAPADTDLWCDGYMEGEIITWADGLCRECGPLQNHKDACCQGLPGFDCRSWPYPSDGKVGTACARHEDCEVGLICGQAKGDGYGICMCPGVDPATFEPPDACYNGTL